MCSQKTGRRLARMVLIVFLAVVSVTGLGPPALGLADPASPLSVTKTASPSPVSSGAEITYTITVQNTGGATVDNVVLADQLNGVGGIGVPPQLQVTSSQGACSQSSLKVTCTAGSIPGRGSWTVTIRGIVTAANGTALNNTASVTATKSAQNFTTTATVQTLVQNGGGSGLADLTISKTGPSSAVAANPMTYILTVNNIGSANATNVRVVDTLPAGVTLSAVIVPAINSTSLFVCTSSGTPVTITCDGGAVNQGSNATITINAIAPASPGNIANTAVVDPNGSVPEANELNNTSATVATTVTSAPAPQGLTVTKTDDPDPVVPGAFLTYTVIVTNNSTLRADDVVVVDGTQGLEAASIVASQAVVNGTVGNNGGCTVEAPQVRCSIRTLDPGGTQTITIRGQTIASAGSTIINTATATGNIRNQGVTATATAQTTVKPAVDLTITKADAPDPVCARSWPTPTHLPTSPDGQVPPAGGVVPTLLAAPGCLGGLSYTLVVGNSGIVEASAVTVRDPLPAGTIFDSYENVDGAGFVCGVDGSNVITCTGGTIPPESTKTLKLLLVAPPTTGVITNVVTVDPNNAIYEADETNNTFTQTTDVRTGIDLVVRKDDSPIDPPGAQNVTEGFDPIATSGTVTYTITIDNVGTQDVTGIRLRDTLPEDTKFLAVIADATHGFTCSHDGSPNGGTVECVGGRLLGTESEFYDPAGGAPPGPGDDVATVKIKVFARRTVGPMHNEVRVDPLGEIAEYDELNNLATQDTTVTNGGISLNAYNELKIKKQQTSPVDGSSNPIPVATNGVITYTITVWNDATDPVGQSSPVVVKDTLPQGFRYIEAKDTAPGPDGFQCVQGANVQEATCTAGGPLSGLVNAIAGVPVTRTITVKAFAAGTPSGGAIVYTNQADVDPDNTIPEGDEFNNRATVVTEVKVGGSNVFNELVIKKCDQPVLGMGDTCDTDTPNSFDTNGEISYYLRAENLGSDPAFNVTLQDTLPVGTTFVAATDETPSPGDFICTFASGTVTCAGGTLDGTGDFISGAGAFRDIKIVVKAPNQHNITITNQAFIDPMNVIAESNETNNQSSDTSRILSPRNLKLDKQGPDTAHQNDTDKYTLTVTSTGTSGVTGVVIRDPLPVGLIPLSIEASPSNFTCQVLENPVNVVECVGDMGAAGSDTATVTITINVFITQDGGTMDNEACVDPDNTVVESNETDNCKTKSTVIFTKSPDLFVNKIAETGSVSPGEYLNYTITVQNDGNATAAAVAITDTLPVASVDFVSAIASNSFDCTFSSPTVTCTRTTGLAPGEFTNITVQVKVKESASGTFTNTAAVPDNTPFDPAAAECAVAGSCANEAAAGTDSTNADNSRSVTTSVGASGIDLMLVSVEDNPDPVAPGGIVTYKAVVSNAGTANASSVLVRTELTASTGVTLTHVSSAGSNGFLCTFASFVDCNGSLPAGATTTIDMLFQVTGTVPPDKTVTITTMVDPLLAIAESDETNNQKGTVTTVHANCAGCIDLLPSEIVGAPNPVAKDNIVTFYVGIGNAGDTPSGVFSTTLTIDNAADIDFGAAFDAADYSATGDFTCTALGNIVECDDGASADPGLAPGEGVLIALQVHVKSTATNATVSLTAVTDSTNVIAEFSESNNTKSGGVGVLP